VRKHRTILVLAATAALLALPVYSVVGRSGDGSPPADYRVLEQTALGNTFTYQGRLTENNNPANGTYDFQFTIYGAASGSAQVCPTAADDIRERGDVVVTNGVFSVDLEFCAAAFDGDARWLEIGVRPGSSTGTYTILSPRQPINPTPYALYAKASGGFTVPFTASGATTGTASLFSITQTGTATGTVALNVDGASGTGAKIAGDVVGLEVDGPLKVSGTKSAFPVVVETGTGENVCDPTASAVLNGVEIPTTVANAATDLLFVTVAGETDIAGFGVVFDDANCANDAWVIYALDDSELPDGLTFNVLVIKQ
jgi:hypothetical protein